MNAFSASKQMTLAILSRVSCTFSICGSTLILLECFYHDRQRLQRAYNRLISLMALFHIIESLWNLFSMSTSMFPFPRHTKDVNVDVDVDTVSVASAAENDESCKAGGFFLQLSIVIPILNAFIALYFLLVIRCSWSEEKIHKVAEPWFYVISLVAGFGTAFASIPLDLYHMIGWRCYIGSSKSDVWSEGTDAVMNDRKHYGVYQLAFYFVPLFVCFATIAASAGLLVWTIRELDPTSKRSELKRTKLYAYGKLMDRGARGSTYASFARNGFAACYGGSAAAACLSTSLPYDGMVHDVQHVDYGKRIPTLLNDTLQRLAKKLREHTSDLCTKQYSTAPLSFPIALRQNQDSIPAIDSPAAAVSSSHSTFNNLDIHDDLHPGNKIKESAGVAHLLEESEEIENIMDYSVKPRQSSIKASQLSAAALDNIDYSNSNTKQVVQQALFYIFSFSLTSLWSTVDSLFILTGKETPFEIVLFTAFFRPLQGFINCFIFLRPKIIGYKDKFPSLSTFQRVSKAVMTYDGIRHDYYNEMEDCAREEVWKRNNMRA